MEVLGGVFCKSPLCRTEEIEVVEHLMSAVRLLRDDEPSDPWDAAPLQVFLDALLSVT